MLGDDRGQSVAVTDDFRGAGLSHLLVVSGENVAFVMAVALPLLRRLSLRPRWLATLAVVGFFAMMTRFEPSVLRATAMAAIAVTAWMLGRPASGVRMLAWAVTGLVLVDPMLVGITGFQLSVAATAGVLVLARPLADHLPLPPWLAAGLGVTLAAQAAVGPLLAGSSSGLPLAGVPANLLAEPAAALIMAWGLTAGAVAGIAGQGVARILHWPTNVLLWWVEQVARRGADAPIGQVGLLSLAVATGAAVAAVLATRATRRGWARVSWILMVTALVVPAMRPIIEPPVRREIASVGSLWRAPDGSRPTVLVLAVDARAAAVLRQVRAAGIDRIDLLVSPTGGAAAVALVTLLRSRLEVGRVWLPSSGPSSGSAATSTDGVGPTPAPAAVAVAGGAQPPPGSWLQVGSITVDVVADEPILQVEVRDAGGPPQPSTPPEPVAAGGPAGPDPATG